MSYDDWLTTDPPREYDPESPDEDEDDYDEEAMLQFEIDCLEDEAAINPAPPADPPA